MYYQVVHRRSRRGIHPKTGERKDIVKKINLVHVM